jgi:ROK family
MLFRSLKRIRPRIEFGTNPAGKAGLPKRRDDPVRRDVATVDGREGEGLLLETLEVHIGDARRMLPNERRRIAAGRREMGRVGKRIGAGLASDGVLFRGAQGAVGLIGSVPVTVGDRTGTLEAMAGSDHIAQDGKVAAENGASPILAEHMRRGGDITALDVAQAAQMGDAAAIDILAQSGRLIGQVVATLANMLNPALIVLSGSIAQTNDILLAAAREAIYGACHPLVSRDLQIIRSQMGSSSGLVGAAIVATEGLFAPAILRDWIMAGRPQAHPLFQQVKDEIAQRKTIVGNTVRPPDV